MAGPNTSSNISPRPDSIVQTNFTVGHWPAGPEHVFDQPLAPVDRAAGSGSIFHRRSATGNFLVRPRQAAFMPPITIPNSPLQINIPSPGSSRTNRANPGGSPLPPPTSLLACLPDFPACTMERCGSPDRFDYHINGEELDLGYNRVTGEEGKDEWAKCLRCDDYDLRKMMHKLPCGHLLCDYHLSQVAIGAVEAVKSDSPVVRRQIREAAGELGRLRRDLAPREMTGLRASQEARMARFRGELLNLLGLSCCGQDMNLCEDWILCLDEGLARALWAVTWRLFRGEGQDGTMICAWPDCRAAIPLWCSYNVEAGRARRWYCAACEGNSMWHGRNGDLWPAR